MFFGHPLQLTAIFQFNKDILHLIRIFNAGNFPPGCISYFIMIAHILHNEFLGRCQRLMTNLNSN